MLYSLDNVFDIIIGEVYGRTDAGDDVPPSADPEYVRDRPRGPREDDADRLPPGPGRGHFRRPGGG